MTPHKPSVPSLVYWRIATLCDAISKTFCKHIVAHFHFGLPHTSWHLTRSQAEKVPKENCEPQERVLYARFYSRFY